MTIHRIKKKYCTDDKVQVMFSNAPSQIILSKDGYLYLRNKDVTIHRYLTDPVRKEMPYRSNPSSGSHATHLFEYNKIYAKFTKYRDMRVGFHFEDSYSLTFLYFVRTKNGEAIYAEFDLSDFKSKELISQRFSKADLENFLYKLDGAQAKCIFEWYNGIRYVKHIKEGISIDSNKFLNLSDEAIINFYNFRNQPLHFIFSGAEKEIDESWEVHNIEEVQEFVLTNDGVLQDYNPVLLVIESNEMYVIEFIVKFIHKDCFEVKGVKRKISLSYDDILRYARNCEYPIEPYFLDE